MTTTSIRLSLRYTLVFIVGLLFISSSVSAQIWNPPTGAPPNNNAPAPIHEGQIGQGKGWGDLSGSPYTLGAILTLTQGLFSEWAIADNQGVAATRYCLGTEAAIATSSFPFGTTGLDCITAADGWPNGGGGGGGDLPAATAGQTLFFNEALGVWQASEFLRSIDGGIGDSANKIMLGYELPNDDDVEANVSIHGSFKYTVPNQPGSFYTGKVLGSLGAGTVSWLDPATLGLGGALPIGTVTGQILYWDSIQSIWKASPAGILADPSTGILLNYADNKRLTYGNGGTNCPQGTTLVGQTVLSLFTKFNCTQKLIVDETGNKVTIDSENAVFTKLEHTSDVRPVCAEEDGDLALCGNTGSGTWQQTADGEYVFTVPEGVFEVSVSLTGAGGGGGAGGLGRAWHMMGSLFMDTLMAGGGGGGAGGRGQTPQTQVVDVVPGDEIIVEVGTGGLGGCAFRAGGGSTSNCYTAGVSTNSLNHPGFYNGKIGQNGGDTTITFPDGTSLVALGGGGGGGGSTAPTNSNPNFPNPTNIPDYLEITPGGIGGINYMVDDDPVYTDDQEGQKGQVYHDNVHNMINNADGCWQQNKVAAGGNGGTPLDGNGGNGGAGIASFGTWQPDCGNNNYLVPQATPKGSNGSSGVDGSGQGGGGGGGGASIAGWPSNTNMDVGANDLGHGGFGGKGGDGRVTISW
jgi:hypothetical protein